MKVRLQFATWKEAFAYIGHLSKCFTEVEFTYYSSVVYVHGVKKYEVESDEGLILHSKNSNVIINLKHLHYADYHDGDNMGEIFNYLIYR